MIVYAAIGIIGLTEGGVLFGRTFLEPVPVAAAAAAFPRIIQ